MTPIIVIITVLAYFAVLFGVSYWAGRKADNAGFFQGGKQSKWYMVAFAMIGASISGVTYVSVPGMVGASQFGYLHLIMGFMEDLDITLIDRIIRFRLIKKQKENKNTDQQNAAAYPCNNQDLL